MKTCLFCGSPSGRCRFCRDCEKEKHRASAMVSQNCQKLSKLLHTKWITMKGYEKFLLYTDNIIKYGKILMKYKTAEELRNMIIVNGYRK